MTTFLAGQGGPLRWKAAGILAAHLPNTRGRDRVVGWVHGRTRHNGPVRGQLHNGLAFSFPDTSDGSVRSIMALRYRPPILAPVLRAVLKPGDCFYDVGANYGIYTLWSAPLVGPTGEVHAFELVPATRDGLNRLVRQNALANVTVVASAAGAYDGSGRIRVVPGASGLAHLAGQSRADNADGTEESDGLAVTVRTLDGYAWDHRPPNLIKIDVEGHELAVLRGARELLATHHPAVVFEFISSHQARANTPSSAIPDLLADCGYQIFNLTTRDIRPVVDRTYTVNVLALSEQVDRHRAVASKLERTRFSRNQTT